MNSEQLQCIINCDPRLSKYIEGVYPSDGTPIRVKTIPGGIICNNLPHYMRGEHWVCLYITPERTGEFFCSLGLPIEHYSKQFTDFFVRNGVKHILSNTKRLQCKKCTTCGYWVLYFLLKCCQNISMFDIVNEFDSNFIHVNDDYVYEFIVNSYPYCFSLY